MTHKDILDAVDRAEDRRKGQQRLDVDLGPCEVPKRREPKPDSGHADLPLFNTSDDRQTEIQET